MTEPKKRTVDRTGPLDEFTIAARVCRILETWPAEEADVEKEVREAIKKRHEKRQADIDALYARATTDERRIAANNLVAARRLPLNGFELYAAPSNDPAPESTPDSDTSWLNAPVPEADRIEVDREENTVRRVGKGRG